ncbi:GLPGLI family protein [Pseudofulvibacter geojedonensis]|uniref:GLPGLI family protein n=1 Tax=Pseudofulvibacter geojedonensis TaxID=1123758 RepID=A0ABW3I4R6_9FLAO
MKLIITSFLLLFSMLISAQDFQGKAIYQSKTSFDFSQMGPRAQQMSEEQKKQMLDRMKPMLEKTYVLTFNKSESVFKEEEKLEAPGQGGGWGRMMGKSFSPGKQYKDIKENKWLEKRDFFGKQFLIKEPLKKLDWKLGSETKIIGNYTCYKATAIKEVDEMDWRSMRRRKPKTSEDKDSLAKDSISNKDPMSEIETPKTIEVTAWYTPQVPVSQGPSKYWGLPGLILEVNADRTTILCTKIVMNPGEKETIEAPSKGKEVTTKEYNDIVKKKMEEMREMYRGRRGGGGFRH